MKLQIKVLDCNAPAVSLTVHTELGGKTVTCEPGKSFEVEGVSVSLSGMDNRPLTAEELEARDAERKEMRAREDELKAAGKLGKPQPLA